MSFCSKCHSWFPSSRSEPQSPGGLTPTNLCAQVPVLTTHLTLLQPHRPWALLQTLQTSPVLVLPTQDVRLGCFLNEFGFFCKCPLIREESLCHAPFSFNPHQGYVYQFAREREREKETEIYLLPPVCLVTQNQTQNLGMYPNWRTNPQPFCVGDDAPTN